MCHNIESETSKGPHSIGNPKFSTSIVQNLTLQMLEVSVVNIQEGKAMPNPKLTTKHKKTKNIK
jgi:hypothetical protein